MKRLLLVTVMLSALLATGVSCYWWGSSSKSDGPTGPGAYTLLHVARQPPYVMTKSPQDKEEFEGYSRNQRALLKLSAPASRDPKVASLSIVREQTAPVEWLEKNLIIDNPVSPEILRIAMLGDDSKYLSPSSMP